MPKQDNTPKRVPAISVETNPEQGLLNITFANGQKLNLHVSELSQSIREMGLLHGIKQKLVDAAAIARNPDTGLSATVDDKIAAVFTVYDRLMAGEWNAQREGGGQLSLLLAALIETTGKAPDVVKAWLDKKSDAEKKALALNPKVAEVINRIRAERLKTADIDTDGMLDELDGIEE